MSTSVQRASALANVVFGVLIAASAVVRLQTDDGQLAAWLGLVGTIFGVFGLIGLYVFCADRLGRWGPVAFVAAMTGLTLSVGQLYGLTFTAPPSGPLGPLFPLGYGPLLFGFLALDLLLLRVRRLPVVAVPALILGAVLNAAGFATPEVRLAGVVVFGAGLVGLGLAVLSSTTRAHSVGARPANQVPVIADPTDAYLLSALMRRQAQAQRVAMSRPTRQEGTS